MVEAVTARVSVLPVVGSDLPIGLSDVVGVTKQLEVDLGDTLDKVGMVLVSRVFVRFRRSVCRIYVKSVISCFLGCGQWPF